MTQTGWDTSAAAWIAGMGTKGDPTRADILDAPMLDALPAGGEVLDVGCGEGRFCRLMQARGLRTHGVDPTEALLSQAATADPAGQYTNSRAESLPFAADRFDAVVFYLSLIDIEDFRSAIAEAVRVLVPGGRLVVANLHPHATARPLDLKPHDSSWMPRDGEGQVYAIDEMTRERAQTVAWSGVRIVNFHRPLSAYMNAFLNNNLTLTRFVDPPYTGSDEMLGTRWHRMPWAFQMVWEKKESRQWQSPI